MDLKGHASPPPNKNYEFDTIESPCFQGLLVFFRKIESDFLSLELWNFIIKMHPPMDF